MHAPSRIRGSTTGTRANRPSAKRIRETYGEADVQTEYPSKKVSSALPDTRTQQEHVDSEIWVSPSKG